MKTDIHSFIHACIDEERDTCIKWLGYPRLHDLALGVPTFTHPRLHDFEYGAMSEDTQGMRHTFYEAPYPDETPCVTYQ